MRYLVMGALLAAWGCSSVHSVYLQAGYTPQADNPIKRINVAAWAPHDDPGLGAVLGHVASDLVMLRKNYLVYQTLVPKQSWAEGCVEKADGVLLLRTLDTQAPHPDSVFLSVAAELYRCTDGALVWRADASGEQTSADANLTQMIQNYVTQVGPAATRYAAPAFVLLQQLVKIMPDPTLNDADVEEKIQLGTSNAGSKVIAAFAQLGQ